MMLTVIWIMSIAIFLLVEGSIMCLWELGLKTYNLEFCNPIWWRKNKGLNNFGSAFIAVLVSITILPYAAYYWFYKLCAVKRR